MLRTGRLSIASGLVVLASLLTACGDGSSEPVALPDPARPDFCAASEIVLDQIPAASPSLIAYENAERLLHAAVVRSAAHGANDATMEAVEDQAAAAAGAALAVRITSEEELERALAVLRGIRDVDDCQDVAGELSPGPCDVLSRDDFVALGLFITEGFEEEATADGCRWTSQSTRIELRLERNPTEKTVRQAQGSVRREYENAQNTPGIGDRAIFGYRQDPEQFPVGTLYVESVRSFIEITIQRFELTRDEALTYLEALANAALERVLAREVS